MNDCVTAEHEPGREHAERRRGDAPRVAVQTADELHAADGGQAEEREQEREPDDPELEQPCRRTRSRRARR